MRLCRACSSSSSSSNSRFCFFSESRQKIRKKRDGAADRESIEQAPTCVEWIMVSDVPNRGLWIDGSYRPAFDNSVLPVIDPSTENEIGSIPDAGAADIDLAVQTARQTFQSGVKRLSASSWML